MAFIPMLPALSYMFVIALVFGLYDRFATLTGGEIVVLLAIVGVSVIVDHTAGLLGAKYGGAHTKSLLWGMLGAFIGLFTLPVLGSFIGLFFGVLVSELYYNKHHVKALKAASGAVLGSAAGVGINTILSIIFLLAFIALALK
jgi:hypothetical protein